MRPDAHALLAPYAADALGAADARAVEEHLGECPTCREDLAAMRESLAEVARTTAATPPPGMRDAVLTAARRTPQERIAPFPEPAPAPPAALLRRVRGAGLLALAASLAALLAVGGGAVGWALGDRPVAGDPAMGDPVAELLAAPGTEVARVAPEVPAGVGDGPAGEVVAVVNDAEGRGALVARGLPAAPAGRTWQAWSLAGEDVRSEGVFEVGEDGVAVVEFALTRPADAVAVSLEPAGGSPAPTTDPVAVVALR
ncbi:MAG: anti-sigma factor domain-containing protein [Kineosporiaceae bacterium]